MLNTPILITAFNRPDHTQQVFDVIRKVKPKYLFVSIDGGRSIEENEKITQTKKIFENIDWNCEFKTLYLTENVGCKLGVSGGIDWFFDHIEYGIILEDDCVPSTDFLFLTEILLEKYKNQNDIFMIGGHNMLSHITKQEQNSYFFTPFPFIWGWATWKRAWIQRDLDITNFESFIQSNKMDSLKINNASKKYLINKFVNVRNGKIDSWAYGWFYTMLKNQAYSITFKTNLIVNIGFGEESTHTKTWDYSMKLETLEKPIQHPSNISISHQYDQAFFYKTQKKKSELIANQILPQPLIRLIKKLFSFK